MIVQARNSISGSTLRVSLLGYNENCVKQSLDCDDELYNCNINEEVEKLLTVDDITFFKTLTGDEILKAVEEDENEVPSHSEAYSCFKVGLKWMEQQKEFSATQLMIMRHICDVAARKLSWFKQKL
ncbi:hypothetical protein T05_572 [Trichinella murrelli]|uniref:Jerky-like protein-like n=1 Tax=Trichinella murrelli TaxID=144512 RepID=A0A0V0U876_9BILA|nr:hypothetical protein T05_572 [Trichinella murrelli]